MILLKTYEEYENEYNEAVKESILQNKQSDNYYVVKKDVWISCKWEKDTGFAPFNPNAEKLLDELKKHDKKLYNAVINGMLPFGEISKE